VDALAQVVQRGQVLAPVVSMLCSMTERSKPAKTPADQATLAS
jgi:hypothetical protein